jgi:beta-N-acetylhexosaminidase
MAIRSVRQTPLLIMVDQEGGRVQRFINEFTLLPFMGVLGKLYDNHAEKAFQLTKECGWLMATELLSVGIDLSLAPVLDLNKALNSVIGERAFHSSPQAVIKLAHAFVDGMNEAGMAATGKHFPGHGSVTLDSHYANPVDLRELDEIEKEDMLPFIEQIKGGIQAIMAAHILYPKVDALPASYSSFWLKDILRHKLKFTGVVLSDDLNMEGANISSDYSDRFIASREAGCDFVLLCNNQKGVYQVLDKVIAKNHSIPGEKWKKLQGDFTKIQSAYRDQIRWQVIHDQLCRLTDSSLSH